MGDEIAQEEKCQDSIKRLTPEPEKLPRILLILSLI